MSSFTIGEEVIYDDERYVIAGISRDQPPRYRLLATTPKGARVVWVSPQQLKKMARYTEPVDDTGRY